MIQENPILVSVLCATYNHEKYITACLQGLVSQKANFCFEILVHDDASTDGTRDIVLGFEKQYPHLIRTICQTENRYSKNDKIYTNYIYPVARGKYFAMCEGDDYWTDLYKLQKQVDFLEHNPDYSLVYTNYTEYIQSKEEWREPEGKTPEGYVYEYLLKGWIRCRTMTVCYRREIHDKMPLLAEDFFTGDWLIFLTASLSGRFKYLPEVTGVYRILQESACHFLEYRNYCAFVCKTTKTKFYFWDLYPLLSTRENWIEKKKNYFLFVRSALVTGKYEHMKYVRFLPTPLWSFGSVVNTALCLLCKSRLFFSFFSFVVNRFCYSRWQKSYTAQFQQ